jgi:hypothetical protein
MIELNFKHSLYCNSCERETTHLELANRRIEHVDRDEAKGDRNYQVLACRQCSHVTYRTLHWVHPGLGGDSYLEVKDVFPPPSFRPKPKWYPRLDERFRLILDEVYLALDHGMFFVASTGTRTALDVLIVDSIGDIGNFKEKIDDLVKRAILEPDLGELLRNVIDAGSASAHRGFKPDAEAMKTMMDITEQIFYRVCIEPQDRYQLKVKAEELQKQTPKRS